MKFRRGGGIGRADVFQVAGGETIEFVNHFPSLGAEIHFNYHLQERSRKALVAIAALKRIDQLSIDTALKIFKIKVAPIASYGVQVMWQYLTLQNLKSIERTKATFLKRCLGIAKTSRSRYAYVLSNACTFVDDIKATFGLEETQAYLAFAEDHNRKRLEILPEFYNSPGMMQHGWMRHQQPNRHVTTRYSVHGFHHKICTRADFHEGGSETCFCRLCHSESIGRYHLLDCPANNLALSAYAD
jgi:hypothetical protein